MYYIMNKYKHNITGGTTYAENNLHGSRKYGICP